MTADTLEARLTSSAERCAELDEAQRAEQSRRNDLVVQARDEGRSWRWIAQRARLSVTRCTAIVADAA